MEERVREGSEVAGMGDRSFIKSTKSQTTQDNLQKDYFSCCICVLTPPAQPQNNDISKRHYLIYVYFSITFKIFFYIPPLTGKIRDLEHPSHPGSSRKCFPTVTLSREDIQTNNPWAIKEQEPPVHPAGATDSDLHKEEHLQP